ncbi:MAG: Asp-tRNA(Asn)/Glu-tRNA(Gln) amidotransferase subunit GatC [Thiotrichaceae bacterium]|nr:Asp-tRNA(Asn)/Glu-tRNA(Gln) amidotransferase subunit GatC [Thiotrichaceae bacterium]
MSLSADEVKKIAYLARISIKEENIHAYAENLSGILDLVAQMDAVNTDNVKPMAHPQEMIQRLREDKVTEVNQREQFQRNAPATEVGLYLVPKVIE